MCSLTRTCSPARYRAQLAFILFRPNLKVATAIDPKLHHLRANSQAHTNTTHTSSADIVSIHVRRGDKYVEVFSSFFVLVAMHVSGDKYVEFFFHFFLMAVDVSGDTDVEEQVLLYKTLKVSRY